MDQAVLVDDGERVGGWAHPGGAAGMELCGDGRANVGREGLVGADRVF